MRVVPDGQTQNEQQQLLQALQNRCIPSDDLQVLLGKPRVGSGGAHWIEFALGATARLTATRHCNRHVYTRRIVRTALI